MKMKSFIFALSEVNPYVSSLDGHIAKSSPDNEYIEKMDKIVNDFCKGKNVVDIQKTSHCQGNNPPRYYLDITVLYN